MNKIDEIVEREFPSTRFPVLNEYSKDQLRSLLQEVVEPYRKGLLAVEFLISESKGVAGLHLNGDIATWAELQTGGKYDGWLTDFDTAIAAAEVRAIGEDAITVLAKGK